MTNGSLVSSKLYYDTGEVQQSTDPCLYKTTYQYNSASPYYGAYLTKVTNQLSQSTSYGYDSNTGAVTSITDPNSQPTYKQYDILTRLTQVTYPDNGSTSYCYTDMGGSTCTQAGAPYKVVITKAITSSPVLNETSTIVFDGLGRLSQTQLNSDSPTTSYTQTTYDALGRKYQVYNPTRCNPPTTNCGEGTWGYTTYNYDPLNRVTSVVEQDGSSTVSTSYTGRATEVSDEGNGTRSVQRISQVDGLGRLTNVCEVTTSTTWAGTTSTPAACGLDISPATGFLTSYQYDALNNLTTVTQGGLNGRSFQYDSLSQLTTAQNPESGKTTYAYDVDGNVTQRTAPKPNQTGSATVATTYAYDKLNRLTGKTYNDGSTPSASFSYDQTAAWNEPLTNSIGRLTETITDNNLAEALFSYDPMGRVTTQFQCTPLTCGTTSIVFFFGYDLLGDLTSSYNDGDNITYTNTYDGAARLTSVKSNLSDSQHPGTLITLGNFTPFQKSQQVTLGNGIVEILAYTNRNQIQSTSESPNIYGYSILNGSTIGYAPDGNILYSNDGANGNWAYTYDDLNQLTKGVCSANCPATTGVQYTYDRYGNRWQESVTGSGIQPSYTFNAYNHITGGGIVYDAAGNVTNDGFHVYFYDAENRIVQVDGTVGQCSSATACYVYDAEGHRVRATVSGQTRDFLYDLSGRTIDEFVPGGTYWLGTWLRGGAYAGGLHIATYANSTTEFDNSEWLSTFRVRSDVSGNVLETCTSLPFGEDLTCTGAEVTPIHFTGKERDAESGLDNFGARYDASSMGRFMTPDWASNPEDVPYANFGNPQSLNLYAYALNNPLKLVDTDGHDLVVAAELQNTVTQLRQQSPSFNAELAAHEGPNSPNLTINTGKTPNDPDGSPSIGNTSAIIGGGPVVDCSPNCVPVDKPYTYNGATVTVNDSVTGDKSQTQDVLGHEVGHVHDARTNTDQYHKDSQHTKDTKGKTPHDDRPEEQRANQFKDQTKQEQKQWEKDHCHGFFHKTCS